MNKWLQKMVTVVVITIAAIAIWWPLQCSFVTLPRLLTVVERFEEKGEKEVTIDPKVSQELARSCENSESQSISILIALLAQLLALGTKSQSRQEEQEEFLETERVKAKAKRMPKKKAFDLIDQYNAEKGIHPPSKEEAFRIIEEYNQRKGINPIDPEAAERIAQKSTTSPLSVEDLIQEHESITSLVKETQKNDSVPSSRNRNNHADDVIDHSRQPEMEYAKEEEVEIPSEITFSEEEALEEEIENDLEPVEMKEESTPEPRITRKPQIGDEVKKRIKESHQEKDNLDAIKAKISSRRKKSRRTTSGTDPVKEAMKLRKSRRSIS